MVRDLWPIDTFYGAEQKLQIFQSWDIFKLQDFAFEQENNKIST